MSNGTSKPRRALQLGGALIAIVALVTSITALASAQNTNSQFYSGVITGPDYCANLSLGGPVTYALDDDRDGVADTCSLPRTRRATAARQNAMERLGGELPLAFGLLFAEECLKVSETFGEPQAEATDECAAPRAADAAGRILPAVPAAPIPLESTSQRFFSGPVITSRTFCLNRSFGGPVTYPFDSDGDGVADICSLPRTRRAAVARQNAYERLAAAQGPFFQQLFAEECRRVPTTFGEPEKEATDECATGLPTPTGTPLPTPGGGGGGGGGGATATPSPTQSPITPPTSPVATNPGTYNKRAAQNVVLAPGNRQITVGWQPPHADDNPNDNDDDPYDANQVFEYIVEYSANRNLSGSRQVVLVLNSVPSSCATSSSLGSSEYQCTISGLTNFQTYYVRVRANRGGGSNPYTPTLSITPGLAGPVVWPKDDPETANVDEGPLTSSLYGEIDVRWGAPIGSSGITHYILQWGTISSLPESCANNSRCEQTTVVNTARSHKITGLNNNTTYYVRIQAVTNNGPGTWSTTVSLRLTSNLQTPGMPTAVMLSTAGTGRSLKVDWTKPAIAANDPAPTHYNIQWRNLTANENWSGANRQTSVQGADTVTTTIAGLLALNQYEVRVQAVNARVAGSWSRTARVILGQAAPPTGITLVPGNRQLDASWTEPTSVPAASSYLLQWNTSSGFPSNCVTSSSCDQVSLSAGTETHTISGLQDNRTYYVRMQAINANGPGPWSSTVSAEPGTPIAPTGVSAAEDPDHIRNLDVRWTYDAENTKPALTGFRLQWRPVGSNRWSSRNVTIAQADPDNNDNGSYSYTLTGLTSGVAHEVQVQAANSYGNGQWSASATATPGAGFIPASLAIAVNGINIQASWSQPSGGLTVTSFTVQWRTCGTTGFSCGSWGSSRNSSDGTATSLDYPGSSLRDDYYYQTRVRANGASSSGGNGAYAESARYLVEIDDNDTPSNRTDDTVTVTIHSSDS